MMMSKTFENQLQQDDTNVKILHGLQILVVDDDADTLNFNDCYS